MTAPTANNHNPKSKPMYLVATPSLFPLFLASCCPQFSALSPKVPMLSWEDRADNGGLAIFKCIYICSGTFGEQPVPQHWSWHWQSEKFLQSSLNPHTSPLSGGSCHPVLWQAECNLCPLQMPLPENPILTSEAEGAERWPHNHSQPRTTLWVSLWPSESPQPEE